MRRDLALLQLTFWITGTQAFYPYFPDYLHDGEKRAIDATEGLESRTNNRKDPVTVQLPPLFSSSDESDEADGSLVERRSNNRKDRETYQLPALFSDDSPSEEEKRAVEAEGLLQRRTNNRHDRETYELPALFSDESSAEKEKRTNNRHDRETYELPALFSDEAPAEKEKRSNNRHDRESYQLPALFSDEAPEQEKRSNNRHDRETYELPALFSDESPEKEKRSNNRHDPVTVALPQLFSDENEKRSNNRHDPVTVKLPPLFSDESPEKAKRAVEADENLDRRVNNAMYNAQNDRKTFQLPSLFSSGDESDESAAENEKRDVEARINNGKGFVTFKFPSSSSSDGESEESLTEKARRAARSLAKKYGSGLPSRAVPADSTVNRRENTYTIVSAVKPTDTNSAGVDQDGTDLSYFVQAAVGSAATEMYMLVDTGASTTWVMGTDCTTQACGEHNTFGSQDSTTLKDTDQTFSVEYGSGSVNGEIVNDTMKIAGLSVTMSFGVASNTSSDFTQFAFDGILGLAKSADETGFVQTLKNANLISSSVFGISLSRASDGTNDGEISFGAPDPSKYTGNISYTALDTSAGGSWACDFDEVTVGGQSADVSSKLAYIDTGTTYAFGPPSEVEALFKLFPDSTTADNGTTWSIPCDSTASVAFTFSGQSYNISSKDLMASGSNSMCPCNIFGLDVVSGAWLLGGTFLKNVYSVFDMDQSRIGFATKEAETTASTTTATGTATPTSGTGATAATGKAGTGVAESATAATHTPAVSPAERAEVGAAYLAIVGILSLLALLA